VFFLLWAVLNDLHNVVYYAARIFFNSIVSIFISKVDVIGLENVPFRGPVILAANHSNQFVDGAVLCCSCPHRKVGILIAKKSYDNPVIGFLARAMAAVPISRPQDLAEPGAGVLLNLSKHERAGRCSQVSNASPDASPAGGPVDDEVFRLVGSSACDFTVQLTRGDKISYLADRRAAHGRRSGGTWMWRVVEVESSCACMVTLTSAPTGLLGATAASRADELDVEGSLPADGRYRIFPRGDHERVFDEVFASLGRGACIGIFPEGGSHDRTDLLDLKPGVALMALGATTTTPVPIVPVGLSYFRGHLFRNAKVTVHFGPALYATKEEQQGHAAGGEQRRAACAALLSRIQTAMRGTLVTAGSFEELQLIHVARRLWVGPDKHDLDPAVRQDLDRRFAFGIRLLLQRHLEVVDHSSGPSDLARGGRAGASGDSAQSESAARELELADLIRRLRAYDRALRRLGVRDSQVPALQRAPIAGTLFTLGHMLVMLTIASVPTVVLNAPAGIAAVVWARWRQRTALAQSDVKLRAHDVLLSEKMRFAIVAVPMLWLTYALVLLMATPVQLQDVLTLLMATPLASYVGVISVESGMIALRDLRPMLARLFYHKRQVEALKQEQVELRARVRDEIRRLVQSDDKVAELYHMQGELSTSDWERLRERA